MKQIFTLLVLTFAFFATAQEPECGTVLPEKYAQEFLLQMDEYRASANDQTSVVPLSVPVKITIVRNGDSGAFAITTTEAENALDDMNEVYATANINFFLCEEINFIDGQDGLDAWNLDKNEETILSSRDSAEIVNIYVTNNVYSSTGASLCGYAYYPGGPSRIIMSQACWNNGSTLSHEMGHIFGLLHTHGSSNTTNSTSELADGSNGYSAGDYMRDTPSDPKLSGIVNTNCEYTGSYLDNNSVPHNPDTANIMSYSRKDCRTYLSSEQSEAVYLVSTTTRDELACPTFDAHFEAPYSQRYWCSAPQIVEFQDCSVGAVAWEWDIDGDGTFDYFTESPVHMYTEEGSYDVALQITNEDGEKISVLYKDYVVLGGDTTEMETFTVEIMTDRWPSEISWIVTDINQALVLGGENNYQEGLDDLALYTYEFDATPGTCYQFKINDSYGDGICCTSGEGYWKIYNEEGVEIASGGDFGDEDIAYFKAQDESLSIPENELSTISLAPNPSDGIINISESVEWELYNLLGQKIKQGNGDKILLPERKGVYLIRMSNDGLSLITRKVIRR